MKRLALFCLILTTNLCFGQNIDSLKKVVNGSQQPQKRIKASIQLASFLSSKNAPETFAAAKTGLALAHKLNNKIAEGSFLKDIGKAWFLTARYDSATVYFDQSAMIFNALKQKDSLADVYRLAAATYTKTHDYKKAIEYYSQVSTYSLKKGSGKLKVGTLDQLGILYEDDHNYKEALKCYKAAQDIRDSLNIAQKTKDSISVSYSLDLVGDVFGSMKQKDDSEEALLKTIETKRSLDDTLALSINYMNLGMLYEKKKAYPKALDALQQCAEYAAKINYDDLESSALNEMANLYEQMGNYQQAVAYFKKYKDLNTTINSGNSSKNIALLQTKYENTQKENRMLQQNFEISKRNYWVAGIATILLLGVLLSYFYYSRSKLKQQNIATNAIIETEEKERKRIAQDLHDSVSQLMMAAKINLTVVRDELPFADAAQKKRFQTAINLVDEGFREVRTISHNMMPQALMESGLALVIKQFIENIENDTIKVQFFSSGFEDHFDGAIETILYRILQECVNNVLKHAKASRLDISLIRDEANISMTIEDNGLGFDATDKTKYNGMGLKNMQNRVNFLKGKIELDSKPGNGTLVSVYLPVKK